MASRVGQRAAKLLQLLLPTKTSRAGTPSTAFTLNTLSEAAAWISNGNRCFTNGEFPFKSTTDVHCDHSTRPLGSLLQHSLLSTPRYRLGLPQTDNSTSTATSRSFRSISTSTIACVSKKVVAVQAATEEPPELFDEDIGPSSYTFTPPTRQQVKHLTITEAAAALRQRFGHIDHKQPVDLEAKLQELITALDCTPGQAYTILNRTRALLTIPASAVQLRLQHAADALGCSLGEIQHLCRAHDTVLLLQPESAQQRLSGMLAFLQQELGMEEHEARRQLLYKAGSILTHRVEGCRSKLAALAALCGSEEKARELVRGNLNLLTRKPETVARYLKQLEALAGSHPSWQAAWARVSPGGRYLAMRPVVVERLLYVASRGQQARVSIAYIVGLNQAQWMVVKQKLEQEQQREEEEKEEVQRRARVV